MIDNLIQLTEKQLELFKKEKVFLETNGFNTEGKAGLREYDGDIRTFIESLEIKEYGLERGFFINTRVELEWTVETQKEYIALWGGEEGLSWESEEYRKTIQFVRDLIKKQYPDNYPEILLTEDVKLGDITECEFEDVGENRTYIELSELFIIT